MPRAFRSLLIVTVFSASSAALAQVPFSFKFKEGTPLFYRTTHETQVQINDGKEKIATASSVKQLKRWNVQKVDSLGVATLELSIQELALEQTDPDGGTIKFDSTDASKSDAKLAERLQPIVGKAIIQVQIDATGTVKHYQHLTERNDVLRELPFILTVPADRLPNVGSKWRRDFPIQLEPPVGNGEVLRGVQNCVVKEYSSDRLVIEATSTLLEPLKDPKRMVPILQFLPKGTVTLDPRSGRMVASSMLVDETVADFNGPGSSYHFKSTYTETLEQPPVQQADTRQ